MKAVVAAFNQEKALVGAFSVITNLQMELFQTLLSTGLRTEEEIGVFLLTHVEAVEESNPSCHAATAPGYQQLI